MVLQFLPFSLLERLDLAGARGKPIRFGKLDFDLNSIIKNVFRAVGYGYICVG